MAAFEPDYQQLARLVQWLDEERQRAHAQLERLTAQVQALSNADGVRGQGVAALEGEVRRIRGFEQRLGYLEQATRDVLEPVAELRLRLETLERALQQQTAVRDVTFERTQRQFQEMAQAVDALRARSGELSERLASVGDETRRDRTARSEGDERLDEMRQVVLGLSGRLALLEEDARRHAEQVGEAERRLEVVAREQEREREQVNLLQIQAQRRADEWEERTGAWQRTMSDGQAAAQAAREHVVTLSGSVAEVEALAQRSAEGLAAHEAALSEWRAQQTALAHGLAELRAAALNDRERLRSVEAEISMLAPERERAEARWTEMASGLVAQREYGEQLQAAVRRLERQLGELDEQRRAVEREVRAGLEEARGAIRSVAGELQELAQRVHHRLSELQKLEEQHRQRQIGELEQQLSELQGRARAVQRAEAT